MAMAAGDDPTIVFSVKELISRLDGKLDMMMKVLTDKADRTDVNALDRRVGAVEDKVKELATARDTEAKANENGALRSRFAVTVMLTSLGLFIALASVLVTIIVKG